MKDREFNHFLFFLTSLKYELINRTFAR